MSAIRTLREGMIWNSGNQERRFDSCVPEFQIHTGEGSSPFDQTVAAGGIAGQFRWNRPFAAGGACAGFTLT